MNSTSSTASSRTCTGQDKPPLNGRQFVAEDAAFGLARFGQDNPDFVWTDRYASVDQFDVPDELTLHIKAKEPFAPLLTAVAEIQALMVSRDAVEAFGDDGIASNIEAAIGTGSLQLVSREGDVETVLERNPNYFREGLPYIDEWRMPWILDVAQRIAQYVAGEFDFLSLPWAGSGAENDTLRSQIGEEDYTTVNMLATWGVQTWFHTKVEPYTDARVRKALHLATDREQIAAIFPGRYGIGGVLPAAIAPYGQTVDELRARLPIRRPAGAGPGRSPPAPRRQRLRRRERAADEYRRGRRPSLDGGDAAALCGNRL